MFTTDLLADIQIWLIRSSIEITCLVDISEIIYFLQMQYREKFTLNAPLANIANIATSVYLHLLEGYKPSFWW